MHPKAPKLLFVHVPKGAHVTELPGGGYAVINHTSTFDHITGQIFPLIFLVLFVFMALRMFFGWKGRLNAAQTLRAKLQADSDAYAEAKAAAQATATGGSVYINSGGAGPIPPEGARIIELEGERTRQTAVQSETVAALPPGKHFERPVGRPELDTIKRRRKVDEAS
jgi:hypothetical protein